MVCFSYQVSLELRPTVSQIIIVKLFWLAYAVRSAIGISIGLYSIMQYNIRVKYDIKRIIDPSSDNIDDNEQIN